jgi:hypothetical protein
LLNHKPQIFKFAGVFTWVGFEKKAGECFYNTAKRSASFYLIDIYYVFAKQKVDNSGIHPGYINSAFHLSYQPQAR